MKQEKSYNNLEHSLFDIASEINSAISVDVNHQFGLRRALLNSRFYHKSFFIRLYFRVIRKNKKIFIATSAFCASILVFTIASSYIDFENLYIKYALQKNYVERVYADDIKPHKLQDLYRFGYLKYSHEDEEGNRIYKAKQTAREFELIDSEPYKIDLVLAD